MEKGAETVLRTAAAIYVITAEESDVRGFADIFSKGLLVLIDGRSLYTPLVGGVHWAIQELLLADLQQIEVIRGPGGSIWGANAVNRMINIVTRAARQTRGLYITAAGAGPVERGQVGVRYGGDAAGGALDYRVYVKAFSRGPQFHRDVKSFDEWNSVQTGAKADWRAGPNTLTVSGDMYRTEAGERASVSFYSPPSMRDLEGQLDLTGGNAIARWDHQFAGGGRSRLQAYFDRTPGLAVESSYSFLRVTACKRSGLWKPELARQLHRLGAAPSSQTAVTLRCRTMGVRPGLSFRLVAARAECAEISAWTRESPGRCRIASPWQSSDRICSEPTTSISQRSTPESGAAATWK